MSDLGPIVLNPAGTVRTVSVKEAVAFKAFPELREGLIPATRKEKKRIYDQKRYQALKNTPGYMESNRKHQREYRARQKAKECENP